MSNIESPSLTTLKFIESWHTQDPQRLTAELISVKKETNREPDTYHFDIVDGLLIDPETKTRVLNFIAPGVEYEVAKKLQSWAKESEEGLAYWISPRSESYPCEKIIIHKIAYTWDGQKVIMNSAILFNAKLENAEKLRKTLFTTTDSEAVLIELLNWIEEVSREKVQASNSNKDAHAEAVYFSNKIKSGIDPRLIVDEMSRTGFLGKNPISCSANFSPTFSDYITSKGNVNIHSGVEDQYGSLSFECPKCNRTNHRSPGLLLANCQHCNEEIPKC